MKLCTARNCNRKHYAKGLCERHYNRARFGNGFVRRDYGEIKGQSLVAFQTAINSAEAALIDRACNELKMTRTAFMRAVMVGEARAILRRPKGADRRGLTLRRWHGLYKPEIPAGYVDQRTSKVKRLSP